MTGKGNQEIIGWWFSRLVQFVHPDVLVMLGAEQLKILKVYFPWKLLRQWTQICLDDCVKSMTDGNSAIFLVPKLWELLSKGGFNLTKWVSNSLHALATIPESESAKPVKDLHLGDMPSQRALGIKWNLELDTFGFRVKVKQKPPPRRSILSVAHWNGTRWSLMNTWKTGNSGFMIVHGWRNFAVNLLIQNLLKLALPFHCEKREPSLVRTDNWTNFVSGEKELRTCIQTVYS